MRSASDRLLDLKSTYRRLGNGLLGRPFSNFDEKRIIAKYVDLLDLASHNRTAVDIGAGDGIRWSNTYQLFSNGWCGLGIEAGDKKARRLRRTYEAFPNVYAHQSVVSPGNIANILKDFDIEKDFSVLSLDIDGNDYWVLEAVLKEFRPRLIVSEFNEKIPPPIKFVVKFNPDFTLRHHFFGYSLAKLGDLLDKCDYALFEVEFNNAFLAPRETPGLRGADIREAYDQGYRNRPDRQQKFPQNANMEALNTLSPEDGIRFLHNFYRDYEGEYEVGLPSQATID
jgi:hypothetical protein